MLAEGCILRKYGGVMSGVEWVVWKRGPKLTSFGYPSRPRILLSKQYIGRKIRHRYTSGPRCGIQIAGFYPAKGLDGSFDTALVLRLRE